MSDYNTSLFRRLTWEGTVPLEIRVDPKELPANSNRGLECYYVQAPRISYLPLIVPEIRRFLMDVVFDEIAAKSLKDEEWWFESEEGTLLKWYVFEQYSASIRANKTIIYRHWPIGVLYDNHTISASLRSPTAPSSSTVTPMRLILHLAAPPNDKLFLSPTIESCKQAFMNQLKEADFIRWGNTKRMISLRKADQDGLWEGIRERECQISCSGFSITKVLNRFIDSFDDFWRVASKLMPSVGSPMRSISPPPNGSSLSRPLSTDTANVDRDSAYNIRSVPVRIYLPDGPVLQEVAPPLLEDGASLQKVIIAVHLSTILAGSPQTLSHFFSTHLPLLFPPQPPPPPPSRHNPNPQAPNIPTLAHVLIQGVISPPDAELAWLGACMAGADGWLNMCVSINRR